MNTFQAGTRVIQMRCLRFKFKQCSILHNDKNEKSTDTQNKSNESQKQYTEQKKLIHKHMV